MNYCRNIQSARKPGGGLVVFFTKEPPFPMQEYSEWAFHHVPPMLNPATFTGKLIGECPHQRCIRRNHAPAQCPACKPTATGYESDR